MDDMIDVIFNLNEQCVMAPAFIQIVRGHNLVKILYKHKGGGGRKGHHTHELHY